MQDKTIHLYEVGPRDGLQNEAENIATNDKIALINSLNEVGFSLIEATSFVSAKWVPQLGDAAEVMAGIARKQGIRYAALTPNMRGYEDARKSRMDEVAVFGAATQSFSQKNINCSIPESLARFRPVVAAALQDGIAARGYISVVVHCPYEGKVAPLAVLEMAEALLEMGCYEISLGDTTGHATPETVSALLDVLVPRLNPDILVGHFHDTRNRAIENVMTCLDYGLRKFDSSVGGLGGCPFAPGAKGNVSTSLLHDALVAAGWHTGLDRAALRKSEELVTKMGLKPR
ncbi:MAG: hydroxymethylglutaryl-CoA lyase [Candidatus Puniceispirillaceae bacterium]